MTPEEAKAQTRRTKAYKRFKQWVAFLSRRPSIEVILMYLDDTIDNMRGYKYAHISRAASRARILVIEELKEGKL